MQSLHARTYTGGGTLFAVDIMLLRIIRSIDNDVIYAQNQHFIIYAIFEFFADFPDLWKCNHTDSNTHASCDFEGDSHIFKGICANKVIDEAILHNITYTI